jgi:hypothetical protein
MVTHDPLAAAYADRVVFLADGAVVGELDSPKGHGPHQRRSGADRSGDGDEVRLQGRRPGARAPIRAAADVHDLGHRDLRHDDNLAGTTLAAFSLPTAQALFGSRGYYDTINVLAKPVRPGARSGSHPWQHWSRAAKTRASRCDDG